MADTNNIESKRSKSSPKAKSNQITVCQSFYLHIEIQVKMYALKAAAGIFQLHIKVFKYGNSARLIPHCYAPLSCRLGF